VKAVIIDEPFKIRIAEVPVPDIREDEVLIRVAGAGICGSDIGIYNGTNSLATYPRLIGHEYGGWVEKTGSRVKNVRVGECVAVDPVRSCGQCYACRQGRPNVCRSLEVTGVHRDGGFAEYVAAPAEAVYALDAGRVAPEYACLTEPYSIGMQVNERGQVAKGDKLFIMGSGPIGICIMQVAKSRGAQVMMTDMIKERLENAERMGADRVLNIQEEDLAAAVYDWTDGEGMPVIADTVCSVSSFPQALELACPAGRVVVVGLIDKPSAVAQVAITKKELTIVGSRLNNHRFPQVIRGFESGALTPDKLCSRIFPYTEAEEAFRLIRERPQEICKIVLRFADV
jgi:L-gulonate 5-dehydrogenase